MSLGEEDVGGGGGGGSGVEVWANAELKGLLEGLVEKEGTEDLIYLLEKVAAKGQNGPAGGRGYKAKSSADLASLLKDLRRYNEALETASRTAAAKKARKAKPRNLTREIFPGQAAVEAWKEVAVTALLEAAQPEDYSRYLQDALEEVGRKVQDNQAQTLRVKRTARSRPAPLDIQQVFNFLAALIKGGDDPVSVPVPPPFECGLLVEAVESAEEKLDTAPRNLEMKAGEEFFRRIAETLADGGSVLLEHAEDEAASIALNPLAVDAALLNPAQPDSAATHFARMETAD